MNQAAKTHCPTGHPYDEANTYWTPKDQRRRCRTCRKARDQARDRRNAVTDRTPEQIAEARLAGAQAAGAVSHARSVARRAAVIEDVEFLLSTHEHPHRIAERLGYKPDTLPRVMYKFGRPDLARAVGPDAQKQKETAA